MTAPMQVAPERPPARWRYSPESVITFVVVAAAVLFVFKHLSPSLLFRDTTANGGDMGAHVWGPAYLRDHLLPHGRLTGWAPSWYAGFPALHFYFPLPSVLVVLLDVVLPYNVAFKLVTILGVVTLPIAAWAFGKLSGLRFPAPPLLAVAMLPFLYDRFHTIYGGNISATLAGEFAFSISLSFGLVFLGLFANGLRTGRYRGWTAAMLACTALSHLLPTFFVMAAAAAILLVHVVANREVVSRRLLWTATSLPVGLLLTGFWVLPFYARLPYTNDMGWEKITAYWKNLFPFTSHCVLTNDPQCAPNQWYSAQTYHLKWVVPLALLGAVISIVGRRRIGTAVTLMALASAFAFRFLPQSRLWNARMLPFWFLCLYLLAALAIAEVATVVADEVANRRNDPGARLWITRATPVVLGLAVIVFVAGPLQALPSWMPLKTNDHSFVPSWVQWNYSGYESKAAFPEYRDVVAKMATIGQRDGCGRAMWEYEGQEDRFGTPMALMLLPYWTKGCINSMEGLFFEAAASTPYHFLNQAELSNKPSSAQRDLPYKALDVEAGVKHLQLMGVRYYMAISPEAIAQADRTPELRLLDSSGPWNVSYPDGVKPRTWKIYEVADSAEVQPLQYQPAVVTGVAPNSRAWLDVAVPWYGNESAWNVPLAASGPKEWQRVAVHQSELKGDAASAVHGAGVTVDRATPVPVPAARVSNIRNGDDRISFDVDRPGTPVLVKTSYFPNWQSSGAKGPWRVTPNLMVVIPTSKHVSLHYGRTPPDWLGILMTLAGFALLFVMWRKGPVVMPVPPAPPAEATDGQLALDFDHLPLDDVHPEPPPVVPPPERPPYDPEPVSDPVPVARDAAPGSVDVSDRV
jgi:hypothetical protein